ncbi:hypothetical protein [Acidimangrovimonas pyrenivorans]|uniref:DUF1127 domain-containing protein n=1 Tax=Acidimangrovimonas pyrenivorans TaxID=2030798 RepID=A0ABV7AB48_9RHOB
MTTQTLIRPPDLSFLKRIFRQSQKRAPQPRRARMHGLRRLPPHMRRDIGLTDI